MTGAAIQVRDLHYTYPDGTCALRGVSFDVARGRSAALIGGNGAGKSTLLLHLAGCLFPQRGEVRIGDTVITRQTSEQARRAVGMVFQDPDDQLFMPTVEEDVAFGPANAGYAPDEIERRVVQALDCVGMTYVRKRPPYRLSAGEKRAAAIATALALEPEILVMDEPSSHLDPRARRRLIRWLTSFRHTRIIATHDLDLALDVCGETLLINAGRIVAQGPTADILSDAKQMADNGLERPYRLGG